MKVCRAVIVSGILSIMSISKLYAAKNMTEIKYTSGISDIKHLFLPAYPEAMIENLMVSRRASDLGFMQTLGIHNVAHSHKAYRISDQGLEEVACDHPINLEDMASSTDIVIPPHTEVKGVWTKDFGDEGMAANIFGQNVKFLVDTTSLTVPLLDPTPNLLAYYGAALLSWGDIVSFPNDSYPLWVMELGVDYVKDYIMNESLGAGMYVEFHHDKPHFHMPLSTDSGGFYLLAKETDEGTFQFSAFKIPYGKAIYTKRGALHNDAGLTGYRWVVGYDNSDNFSTALVYNHQGSMVPIIPLEESEIK